MPRPGIISPQNAIRIIPERGSDTSVPQECVISPTLLSFPPPDGQKLHQDGESPVEMGQCAFRESNLCGTHKTFRSRAARIEQTEEGRIRPQLAISAEKACFVVIKAREFDVKDEVSEPDVAANPSDDIGAAVLENHEDDPVLEEVTSFVTSLSEDEKMDLVALAWLGHSDGKVEEWVNIRAEAVRAHDDRTAGYLLGMPMLGDFLEERLSMLGYSCEEFELNRL